MLPSLSVALIRSPTPLAAWSRRGFLIVVVKVLLPVALVVAGRQVLPPSKLVYAFNELTSGAVVMRSW